MLAASHATGRSVAVESSDRADSYIGVTWSKPTKGSHKHRWICIEGVGRVKRESEGKEQKEIGGRERRRRAKRERAKKKRAERVKREREWERERK